MRWLKRWRKRWLRALVRALAQARRLGADQPTWQTLSMFVPPG